MQVYVWIDIFSISQHSQPPAGTSTPAAPAGTGTGNVSADAQSLVLGAVAAAVKGASGGTLMHVGSEEEAGPGPFDRLWCLFEVGGCCGGVLGVWLGCMGAWGIGCLRWEYGI